MNRLGLILSSLLGLAIFIQVAHSQEVVNLEVGDIAPTFFLRSLENQNFFLSKEIQENSPIVFAFYATWCVPCRQEIPALEKMMTDEALANVRLYYVNVGGLKAAGTDGEIKKQREEVRKVRTHLSEMKISHTILMDRYAKTAQKYGVESLPVIVVIGGDGIIKYRHSGYQPGDETKLFSLLESL